MFNLDAPVLHGITLLGCEKRRSGLVMHTQLLPQRFGANRQGLLRDGQYIGSARAPVALSGICPA